MDLIEIDAASHNGVDDVRDLREKIAFAPSEGRFKVYIIDEVHRFSGAAFDALLKTLEEPPDHAIFILATTELDKVPATIKSRSLMFEFRRVSIREVADRLQRIVEFEGIHAERAALELVARNGTGSVRDSISLLDQLISDPTQGITLEVAEQVLGTASNRAVGKLVDAIFDNDVATGLDLLNQAIDEGADPAQFCRQIVEYLRNVLLVQTGGPSLVDTSEETRITLQEQAAKVSRAGLLKAVRAFNNAIAEVKGGWQPQLPLELALIESTRPVQEEYAPEPSRAPVAVKTASVKAAPAKVVQPEGASTTGDADRTVTLGEVNSAWPAIQRRAKEQDQAIGATLVYASPKSLDKNVLTLAVTQKLFKDKLEDEKRRNSLIQIINDVLGVKLLIKVIIGTGDSASSAVNDTISNDPLVGELMKSGGKIHSVEDSQGGLE
jgi:DNA polymerase-3 subunit gamma/tau